MSHEDVPLLPTAAMARRLGVSPEWLSAEARAETLPAVAAGKTFLFHPPTIERLLLERATPWSGKEVRNAVP